MRTACRLGGVRSERFEPRRSSPVLWRKPREYRQDATSVRSGAHGRVSSTGRSVSVTILTSGLRPVARGPRRRLAPPDEPLSAL